MGFSIKVITDFSAGHFLPQHPGECKKMHGHNFKVEVEVTSEGLNDQGMVIDFYELHNIVRSVVSKLDHSLLNEQPYFREKPPTVEYIALWIAKQIKTQLPAGIKIASITVWETENYAGIWRNEDM